MSGSRFNPVRELRALDADRYLAVLLTPAPARAPLATLFLLDAELARAAFASPEPMVNLIRLAWWRDALQSLDTGAAAQDGPPLLAAIAAHLLPHGIDGTALSALTAAWEPLIESDADDPAPVSAHCCQRGGALFDMGARLLQIDDATQKDVHQAGHLWARAEIRRLQPARLDDQPPLSALSTARIPVAARPLTALARLARRDLASPAIPPRGTIGRQWTMLSHLLSGR